VVYNQLNVVLFAVCLDFSRIIAVVVQKKKKKNKKAVPSPYSEN
jgi:hypothetical protein